MNESELTRDNEPLRAELVAYLDNELDPATRERLEQRLSEDGDYRRELQQLQRAWDLLDSLPRAEADEGFTRTTVEMVAVSAAGDVEQEQHAAVRRRRVGWFVAGGGVIAASLLGYFVTQRIASAPNERLLRDLPVIENLDLYKHADSVEFLRKLDKAGLFPDEENSDAL